MAPGVVLISSATPALPAARACRPFHRHAEAYLALPLRIRLGQEIGPDVRRAAPIRPVDDDNRRVGKRDAGVQFLHRLVIPSRDLAKEDVGEDWPRKSHRLIETRKVVRRNNGPEDEGDVQDVAVSLGDRCCLRFVERGIGAGEVKHTRGQPLHAHRRADRFVVDLLAFRLLIFIHPPTHDWLNEGGSGPIQLWPHMVAAA
jgi:hypothetical protein